MTDIPRLRRPARRSADDITRINRKEKNASAPVVVTEIERAEEVSPATPVLRRNPRVDKRHRPVSAVQGEVITAELALDTATASAPSTLRRNPRLDKRRRPEAVAAEPVQKIEVPADRRIINDATTSWIAVICRADQPWQGAELELLGAAHLLAEPEVGVMLVQLGSFSPATDLAVAGADRLIQTEDSFQSLLNVCTRYNFQHILFADGFEDAHLARRLAAKLGSNFAANVVALNKSQAISKSHGGLKEIRRSPTKILIIEKSRFHPYSGLPCEARLLTIAAPSQEAQELKPLETVRSSARDIALTDAPFIISAGHGVTDWPSFHRLAELMDAVEAGTRRVCDAGDLPRFRQVGASGTIVQAQLYFALGISGAPQHLQGIQKCRYVVAVNQDKHAEIMRRADLAIVADVQAVLPELIKLFETQS